MDYFISYFWPLYFHIKTGNELTIIFPTYSFIYIFESISFSVISEFYKHQRINNGKWQVLKVRFFPSCWPSWRRLKYLCKCSVLKYYHHSITVTSQCSLWNVREWDFTGTMLKISHFVSSCWFFCKINYLYLNLRHSLFYGIGKEITTIRGKYWRPGFVLSSCWPSWRSLN